MSNNSNTHGNGVSGSMKAFDKLPKTLRVALANADHNWSGEQLYLARKRRHHQVATMALALSFLRSADVRKHTVDADAGLVMPGQRS